MRYKLTIAYDGTQYSGWQVQKNGQAIQPLIQQALQTILRTQIALSGSGRTDAGVHARGQTAHFDAETTHDPKRLLRSINALLPSDIRILNLVPVPDDFHARYSAKSKIYHYYLHLTSISDPFTKLYCHQVFGRFDIDLLKQGAKEFLGTYDFTSFANTGKEKDNVRTLFRLDVIEEPSGIRLEYEGNGFLYKMVRNITGTLLDVAAGKISPSEIKEILYARNRCQAAATAPARGLFLVKVIY